jgi:hypothetical protein
LRALYDALDEQRGARGLTWAGATREINGVGPQSARHRIATSTIKALQSRTLAEADGVLQMLRWLGRPPESFVEQCPPALLDAATLPEAHRAAVLRFDTRKLYAAVDEQRKRTGLAWHDVERLSGVSAAHARGLARGGRTAFPAVMRLTFWLARPAADFMRVAPA